MHSQSGLADSARQPEGSAQARGVFRERLNWIWGAYSIAIVKKTVPKTGHCGRRLWSRRGFVCRIGKAVEPATTNRGDHVRWIWFGLSRAERHANITKMAA